MVRGRAPAFFEGDSAAFTGLHFHLGDETFEFYAASKMKDDPLWIDVTELFVSGLAPHIARLSQSTDPGQLATSLHSMGDHAEVRRHQWLDFREQQPEELYEFLRMAVTGVPGVRGMVTVPMSVGTFRSPRYITNYLVFGQGLIGFAAAPPLGQLLAGDFTRAVPVVLVTTLLAAAVINLMRRSADRTITVGGWLIRSVLVFLLFIAWLVLAPNIPHIPPVNRVVLFLVVVAHLFGSTQVMWSLWLPPEDGQKVRLASPPVTPPWYAFSVPLMSLVLATGYFFLTQP